MSTPEAKMTDAASGKAAARKATSRAQCADLLFKRTLDALGGLNGYYVVAEAKRGPYTLDRAYELWEDSMQGEVLFYRDGALYHLDGTPRKHRGNR